jgi:hypothetical protein
LVIAVVNLYQVIYITNYITNQSAIERKSAYGYSAKYLNLEMYPGDAVGANDFLLTTLPQHGIKAQTVLPLG